MEAFLEKIAGSVTKEKLPYLYKTCYIFPTKRAAVFFTDFLQKKFPNENFILPETVTIQDFITQYSTLIIQDDWYLLLELFKIQFELTNIHQPLEKFLPWGKMILKDFDECDKYLVDAKNLFSLLKSQKEIDDQVYLSDELRKYIEQFILTTTTKSDGKENIYKAEFVKTWSLLGEIYTAFRERLAQNNYGYEGMAYREVYENLKSDKLKLPYEHIAFCGFNALSVCEEEIFSVIERNYPAEFFWDADESFMKNPIHEAGNFLRYYQKKFSGTNSHWNFEQEEKEIHIAGISSNVGQATYVAQQLHAEQKDTAIVLCDEQMLYPLLYSLDTSHTNITMGYSVTQSELYLYTNLLLNFFCNARTEGETQYYHKNIEALASHVYLKSKINERKKLTDLLPYFVPFMPKSVLSEFFPENLMEDISGTIDILDKIIEMIQHVYDPDSYSFSVKEAIVTQLNILSRSLKEKNIEVERRALPFLVKQFITSIKVPFETNTQSEIQIMGFLETRILDFENLFILSLNDDKLPGTNKTNSFIPYNLRKGFGLPTFEQFDGINAYHFYRLLKRAKNVHLVYNNQIGDNASEKSRFIRQIVHDLSLRDREPEQFIAAVEDKNEIRSESLLKIKKTPAMTAILRERSFSPSALKVYIKCPLQFYLKYVAGIAEPEEIAEEIDAAVFGQILHKVLELIYHPHLNFVLNNKKIKSFNDTAFIRVKIKQACAELKLPKEITQGSNKLQLKIIERLVEKILENDVAIAPLHVLKTEEKFTWNNLQLEDGSFVSIQGTFDRIDKMNDNSVRIIDYKTGHIELPSFPDITDSLAVRVFLDKLFIFTEKDYGAAFQGILYALMYYKLHHCTEIYVGFHHAKKMKEGITYLNDKQPIPIPLLLEFEQRLSQLVSNIIYKEEFFDQTENENAYTYSPYADLLGIE